MNDTEMVRVLIVAFLADLPGDLRQLQAFAAVGEIPHHRTTGSLWRTLKRGSVLECGGPPPLSELWVAQSARGLAHSRTLARGISRQTF